jgi:hypothetical protein
MPGAQDRQPLKSESSRMIGRERCGKMLLFFENEGARRFAAILRACTCGRWCVRARENPHGHVKRARPASAAAWRPHVQIIPLACQKTAAKYVSNNGSVHNHLWALKITNISDSRVGPGSGLSFYRRDFPGLAQSPARPMTCPGVGSIGVSASGSD